MINLLKVSEIKGYNPDPDRTISIKEVWGENHPKLNIVYKYWWKIVIETDNDFPLVSGTVWVLFKQEDGNPPPLRILDSVPKQEDSKKELRSGISVQINPFNPLGVDIYAEYARLIQKRNVEVKPINTCGLKLVYHSLNPKPKLSMALHGCLSVQFFQPLPVKLVLTSEAHFESKTFLRIRLGRKYLTDKIDENLVLDKIKVIHPT